MILSKLTVYFFLRSSSFVRHLFFQKVNDLSQQTVKFAVHNPRRYDDVSKGNIELREFTSKALLGEMQIDTMMMQLPSILAQSWCIAHVNTLTMPHVLMQCADHILLANYGEDYISQLKTDMKSITSLSVALCNVTFV